MPLANRLWLPHPDWRPVHGKLPAHLAEGPVTLLSDAVHHTTPHVAGQHITLLLDQFPRVLGGGERVVLRLARVLQGAGYRISIVTFQVFCDPHLLLAAGCPVYLLPIDNVFSADALGSAWQLGTFLRRQKVSIVMTFFESSNLFGGIVTKAFSRARLIWNRRDMGILRERKHTAAYRWLPWLPDYVIAVSEQVRRHAVEIDKISPARVGVVYNAIEGSADVSEGNTVHTWPEPPIVITVGNLRRVKGQDILVEAAAIVLRTHPEVQFLLVGEALDPTYVAALQERTEQLRIGEHVRFTGGVPDARSLLQHASIFVLPSRSEGFSNAIVEAMDAGLPVIATRVGGNAEAVVDGQTGLLVDAEDPASLAAAITQLLDKPNLLQQMGADGKRRAGQLFTEQALLERLQQIFTLVAAQ